MTPKPNFLFWALGCFGGFSILLAIGALLLIDHSRGKLADYRRSLEQRGEKLTVPELIPPEPDRKENGAAGLLAAARELETAKGPRGIIKPRPPGSTVVVHRLPVVQAMGKKDISWEDVSTALAQFEPTLEKVRLATRSPRLECQPDFGASTGDPSLSFYYVVQSARLLNQQSLWFLHEGNPAAAVENTIAILRIARMLEKQPLLSSQHYARTLVALAGSATWEILYAENLKTTDLSLLQAAWLEIRPLELLEPTLRMERARAMNSFERSDENERPEPPLLGIWSIAFRAYDERESMADYQALLEHSPEENGNWQPFLKTAGDIQAATQSKSVSRLFSNNMMWQLRSGYYAGFPASEVARNLCLTAIALRWYQLDHEGTLPLSLAELVPKYLPEIPLDPMDGRSLRYHPGTDHTYKLYSVGTDGIDDGGDATGSAAGNFSYLFDRTASHLVNRKDIVWPTAAQP